MMSGPFRRPARAIPGGAPHPGSLYFDEHPDQIPLGEWGASDGQRIVAHDPTIDGLLNRLRDSHVPLEAVNIRYRSQEPI